DLVLLVHVDRELVSEVTLAVLLGPGGIGVFLAPLGRLPVSRHRAFLDELVLFPAVALLGRGYQRRIDDLAATGDEAVLEQMMKNPKTREHVRELLAEQRQQYRANDRGMSL